MDVSTKINPGVRETLRAKRLEMGLTVAQAAERIGVSPSYYSDLETGTRDKSPGTAKAFAIEAAFGIAAREWLTPEERERVEHLRADDVAPEPQEITVVRDPEYVQTRDSVTGAGV